MDWTKAKTILIIAFLVTNIFLAAGLVRENTRQESPVIDETYVAQTMSFLEDQGLVLETELSRNIPSLAPMTVEYVFFPAVETAQRFLGDNWELVGENTFQNQQRQLTITNSKRLILQMFEPENPLQNMNEETIQSASRAFLEAHQLYAEGLNLSQIYVGMVPEYHDEPLHKLVYEQTYEGRFVGESYVHVYLNQQGIVAVEVLLLKNPSETEQTADPRTMIDAPEALLRKLEEMLAENQQQLPVVVSRVEAGYYFPLASDPLTSWEAVASGTAVPAWKIVLKEGDTYYQEAF